MWLRNTCKKYYISVLIGVYLAAVLWITLFSRIGTGYRAILYPFHFYVDALHGNGRAFEEIIENIILFIPLGMVLGAVKRWVWKKVIVIGLCSSLGIELLQVILALGTFEFDDLIHNTVGTVIGCWIIGKLGFKTEIKKLQFRALFIALFMSVVSPALFAGIRHQHMVKLAELHNREDGAENLLVLNGNNGYAWNTDAYVRNLPDGSINVKGTSDKKSWWPIGDLTLTSGDYVFSGLSDVEENTVGLVLETDNHRIIEDVGPVGEVEFSLEETTPIKAYAIVYPGCDCDVIATPVIYKEGKEKMLKKWEELPDFMRTAEVRPYYESLEKKKISLFLKRAMDLVGGIILLILLAIPMMVIAVWIKLDSEGPVFYRQERITAYGKHFKIHKFRTMVSNADKIGSAVTVGNDSRITKVGAKLRGCRLDELPQVLDLISGDMSFVGTRPEAVKYVEKYKPEYMATLLLPAGITSEASIRYKDEAELLDAADDVDKVYVEDVLPGKMKYNLEAIKKFSFFREIATMFRTVFAVLGKEYE